MSKEIPRVFTELDAVLEAAIDYAPAIQMVIRHHGREVYQRAFGWLDPEVHRRPVQPTTLFDLASLTKLFTATAFMALVEDGRVKLDQPVSTLLPIFSGMRPVQPYEDPLQPGGWVQVAKDEPPVDAGLITFRQLLSHSSGLPAWRPLKDQPDAAAARRMALETFFSYKPGEHIVYSDLGLILTGMAVEQLSSLRLDEWISRRVCQPLGLVYTRFLPVQPRHIPRDDGRAAPTEFCRWRNRRIVGEVHDENAWRMGGIAGHAGLFSTAGEVATLGQAFLDQGRPLLQPETVADMLRVQAQEGDSRRGLGWILWDPDPTTSGNPFSPSAYGHTGFTGTSLWVDPRRDIVVSLMTNEVYRGRENRRIGDLRLQVHQAVANAFPQEEA